MNDVIPSIHAAALAVPGIPAATGPAPRRGQARLLVVDRSVGAYHHRKIGDLPALLRSGDLVVLNDAATLPASLQVRTVRGEPLELRLAGRLGPGRHRAALFGAGDWRTPTEARPAPPPVALGEVLTASDRLHFRVEDIDTTGRIGVVNAVERGPRLLTELYRVGRPVQYSYLAGDVPLRAVQTAWGSRPWGAEMASAGRPLSWEILLGLRRAGVGIATLTHGAGLSSVDGGALDATLPLPERYALPGETVDAVHQTRSAGGRVIAIGTTVVRALEGNQRTHGALVSGEYLTDLVLSPGAPLQVVDGLLSNLHEPGESHFELLSAFAPRDLLMDANASAARRGYRAHEFGDVTLIV